MKKRYTYSLLVESEEKNRNILETVLFALFALSALAVIWQFADEPAMPTYYTGKTIEQTVKADFPL
jgi:hypothetical protein